MATRTIDLAEAQRRPGRTRMATTAPLWSSPLCAETARPGLCTGGTSAAPWCYEPNAGPHRPELTCQTPQPMRSEVSP